jgi:hypothetical protein
MATQKENITYIKQEIKKQGVLLERLANAVCGDKDFGQTGLIEQDYGRYNCYNNNLGFNNNGSCKILERVNKE